MESDGGGKRRGNLLRTAGVDEAKAAEGANCGKTLRKFVRIIKGGRNHGFAGTIDEAPAVFHYHGRQTFGELLCQWEFGLDDNPALTVGVAIHAV